MVSSMADNLCLLKLSRKYQKNGFFHRGEQRINQIGFFRLTLFLFGFLFFCYLLLPNRAHAWSGGWCGTEFSGANDGSIRGWYGFEGHAPTSAYPEGYYISITQHLTESDANANINAQYGSTNNWVTGTGASEATNAYTFGSGWYRFTMTDATVTPEVYGWNNYVIYIDNSIVTGGTYVGCLGFYHDGEEEITDDVSLEFSIQYLNQNTDWVVFTCDGVEDLTADIFWEEDEILMGYSGRALTCSGTWPDNLFKIIIDPTALPVTASLKLDDVTIMHNPWSSEIIDYELTEPTNVLNITGRPDSQPSNSLRVYTMDYGWSDSDGIPIGTPEFNPEGGTNPYYYNFDGKGCNYGIITTKQINDINADINYLDWEHSDFTDEYTVYPTQPETIYFNGVINVRIYPFGTTETPYFNVSASCYTDDGRIRREGVGGNFSGGESVIAGSVVNPCDDMVLTDPATWIKCLLYQAQVNIINPLFVPVTNLQAKYQGLYDEIQTKFPFVYVSGGIAQLNTIVDFFDIPQGSPPVISVQAPLGIDWDINTADYSDYFDLIYVGFQVILILFGIFFVLKTAGYLNRNEEEE